MVATQIILAQMNQDLFYPQNSSDRWDLVSFYGNTVSVRTNNNSNGFGSQQDFPFGTGQYNNSITAIAVGDVNNDGFNDVVVVGYDGNLGSIARLYLNNTNGTISTSPRWTSDTYQIPSHTKVMIGDMGGPNDANKNDGWNDVVIGGY